MEEAVRSLLLETAALSALVGTRVDWGVRPQGAALPAVVIYLVAGGPRMNLAGPSGWSRDRLQFDCWGRTYKAARDVADVIANPTNGLLVGMRRDLPGVRIRTFVLNRRSDADRDADGPVHRASVDVMAWHTPLPKE
ncbi:tail completion protein gp17 [Sphingomonas aquatilis]